MKCTALVTAVLVAAMLAGCGGRDEPTSEVDALLRQLRDANPMVRAEAAAKLGRTTGFGWLRWWRWATWVGARQPTCCMASFATIRGSIAGRRSSRWGG